MRTSISALHVLALIASLLAVGCSDDPPDDTPDAGPDSSLPDGGSDGAVEAGPDGDVDGGDGGCTPTVTDAGCYVCPQETIQFLNQCNDGYCSPFNNATRITYPGYTPGGPYPTIP